MRQVGALVMWMFLGLAAVGWAGEDADPPDPAPEAEREAEPKDDGENDRAARIRQLISDLGDEAWATRDAATKALLAIGPAAKEALEAAAKDEDPERSSRAAEILAQLPQRPVRQPGGKPDPKGTDGWMLVSEKSIQCQTLKAAADIEVKKIRIRAARSMNKPEALVIELRETDAANDSDPIAKAEFASEWTDDTGKVRGVTRYFAWFEADMNAKLAKGKSYRLTFRSNDSPEESPWLLNCFYRDTYPDGEHFALVDGKPKTLGKFDLAVELCGEKDARISTCDEKDKEKLEDKPHWGPGYDGNDPPAADDPGGLAPAIEFM